MIMYVHNDLKNFNLHNFEFDFQEAQFGCLKLGRGQKILIGSMYKSPTSMNVNNDNLNVLLDIIGQQEPTNVLLTVDFNFPAINWEKGTNDTDHEDTAYRFIEKLRDCYMNQLVTYPTRRRGSNKPSLLDLVLTNNENLVTSITHSAASGKSDHAMLEIKITCDTTTQKQNQNSKKAIMIKW